MLIAYHLQKQDFSPNNNTQKKEKRRQGFRSVRSILDGEIRLKASVFTLWNIKKNTSTGTKTILHSNFASILLNYYQRAKEGKVGKGRTIMRKQWVATDIIFWLVPFISSKRFYLCIIKLGTISLAQIFKLIQTVLTKVFNSELILVLPWQSLITDPDYLIDFCFDKV